MFANLTGWHALILLAVVLLVFGAAKLPALARSVGQSVRILKHETRDEAADTDAGTTTDAAPTTTRPASDKPLTTAQPIIDRPAS